MVLTFIVILFIPNNIYDFNIIEYKNKHSSITLLDKMLYYTSRLLYHLIYLLIKPILKQGYISRLIGQYLS